MQNAGPGRRLFIGITATQAELAAVAAYRDRWTWPAGARLTPLDDVHLTLHFLGTVSSADEALVRAELAPVRVPPMQFHLVRAEVWPSGVAVLRPMEDEQLRSLHADVGEALSRIGWPIEQRPWKPHVTLARDARDATWPADPPAIVWEVSTFSLVWSRGGSGPTRYQVLDRWPHQAHARAGATM